MGTVNFRQLDVWQRSMQLAVEIYKIVKIFPREELYALSDQMRRAVVSIPSNIAEGRGRSSDKEYLHFLAVARGSVYELSTQLELSECLGFVTADQTATAKSYIIEIEKMLGSLARSIAAPKPDANKSTAS